MLELSQIVASVQEMGVEAHARSERVAGQMRQALEQARLEGDDWAVAQARAATVKAHWLSAACGPESPATAVPLTGDAPTVYTALATDGSQIPLDRHAIAPCYLINVGEIALYYGTGERPRLTSQAKLYYKDEEIYHQEGGGDPTPLSDKIIANRRLLAESAALAELIEAHYTRRAIALVDDPLIVWTPQGESEAEQRRVIDEFCKMLAVAQKAQVPIAGYVSRPGHRDVVGALRLTLCPPGCKHDPTQPCAALAQITDAQLFARLLTRPGDRSVLFGSQARGLDLYPEDQKISFFYLNACTEIARVEIPKWVAESEDLLSWVQLLCWDQARKGQGYPVALSEAHERAVVRGPEREAFFRLIEAAFVQRNVPVVQTRKALAKRTRVL